MTISAPICLPVVLSDGSSSTVLSMRTVKGRFNFLAIL